MVCNPAALLSLCWIDRSLLTVCVRRDTLEMCVYREEKACLKVSESV